MSSNSNKAITDLLKLLELKQIETLICETEIIQTDHQRIYGGQIVAQALVAASKTVASDRPAISLKCDFLRPGNPKLATQYHVEKIREGRSFNTRIVRAQQKHQNKINVIAVFSISFQLPEEGPAHQIDMGDYPKPEKLLSTQDNWKKIQSKLPKFAKNWYSQERSFDERYVNFNDPTQPEKKQAKQAIWYKANTIIDKDLACHQALFAYISDMSLLNTCKLPHGISWFDEDYQSASLDHSIWFHRPFRVDEWLLFVSDSPVTYGARGFNRANIYTEQGELVASLAQEGLIRKNNT